MSNEAWLEGYTKGWYGGVAEGDKKVRVILSDLIVELKDIYYHPYEDTYHPKNDLGIAIGNAEARLKELNNE